MSGGAIALRVDTRFAPTNCGTNEIAIALKLIAYPESGLWQWQHTMPCIASRSDRTFFVREMGEVRLPTAPAKLIALVECWCLIGERSHPDARLL